MRLFFAIIIIALNSAPGLAQEAEFGIIKAHHKFPKSIEGTVLKHDYLVVNTGSDSLKILNYKVACTCTKLEFPEKPIAPGDTAKLTLTFDTKDKFGFQHRSIMVLTNSKKEIHELDFKVTVVESKYSRD